MPVFFMRTRMDCGSDEIAEYVVAGGGELDGG